MEFIHTGIDKGIKDQLSWSQMLSRLTQEKNHPKYKDMQSSGLCVKEEVEQRLKKPVKSVTKEKVISNEKN